MSNQILNKLRRQTDQDMTDDERQAWFRELWTEGVEELIEAQNAGLPLDTPRP